MNVKAIARNVGYALLVSALFMFLSIIVSFAGGRDSAFAALIISFVITFVVGLFPFIFVKKSVVLSLKEAYVIIFLSWLLSFLFGMLPYALWGGPFNLVNAWFESVSGFTTSGATILDNIEALPRSLLFWRSSTHFIGGLGVVVFLLLIIPSSSPTRMKLTNMEISSLNRDDYSSRANKGIQIFAFVYLAITFIAFVAYLLCGMSFFDAICHAFSVAATGGFSTRNLSIGAFDSRIIELVTMILMFFASCHFGLLYMSVATRSLRPLNNPIVRFYFTSIVTVSVIAGVSLYATHTIPNLGEAMWDSTFQTICLSSTSGFAIVDNASWPLLPSFMILMAGVMCGCAGSTSGGLKVDRVYVFLKGVQRNMMSILHPSSVNELRIGKRIVKEEDAYALTSYISLYVLVIAISSIVCLIIGMTPSQSLAGSLASVGNLGPALGEMGNYGSYNAVPVAGKIVFTLDMFLGRVEIFPVLTVIGLILTRHASK